MSKVNWTKEVKSFLYTFTAFLVTEGIFQAPVLLGDFSAGAFKGLFLSLLRAFFVALVVYSYPSLKDAITGRDEPEKK